jgi:hypothetical protein
VKASLRRQSTEAFSSCAAPPRGDYRLEIRNKLLRHRTSRRTEPVTILILRPLASRAPKFFSGTFFCARFAPLSAPKKPKNSKKVITGDTKSRSLIKIEH